MDSFITRIGGKKLLRKTICDNFPPVGTFDRYIEVFGGAAWVLLHKDKHANFEVYNDIDGELVNLMRCVKYHMTELVREIKQWLNSREMFLEAIDQLKYKGLTDIQRAARYFMKIRLSFGADCRSFGCNKKSLKSSVEKILAVRDRLFNNGVVIENKDFEDLIKVYDRETAFFYVDPPYYGSEKYYDNTFTEEDHLRLFQCLKNIKGKFLLSYNDCEYVRYLYEDFDMVKVERANNLVRSKGADKYREVLVRNYEIR